MDVGTTGRRFVRRSPGGDGRVAVVWDRVHVLDGSGTVLFELTGPILTRQALVRAGESAV